MITVLIPKNITTVIDFITVIELIPLNYKTVTVTVTVTLINSGKFFKTVILRREAGPAHLKKIITVITTLQSCN